MPLKSNFGGVREQIKKLEWSLPLELQRALLRTFGRRFNPYSDWNHAHHSIFIHVPRTGGTSVAEAIAASEFHFPASRYAAFDAQCYRDYFKFGFVRNPWDRLLSAYTYLLAAAANAHPYPAGIWARRHLVQFGTFERFVQIGLAEPTSRQRIMAFSHFRPQLHWIRLPASQRVELDFIGRFENLAQDFRVLAQRLSVPPDLPRLRPTSHPNYRDAYTPAMRSIVAGLYRDDIEAFGYDF